MAESKTFSKIDGVSAADLGNHLVAWFIQQKGMEAQGTQTANGFGIQARENSDGWKTISGTTMALQVNIMDAGSCIVMECAYGKWSDKVGAGVVGWFVFAPLAVTAIVGSVRQKKLPDKVFEEAERFLLSGGKSLYATIGRAVVAGEVKCQNCGALNGPDQRFCTQCGAKLGMSCGACGAQVSPDDKFCPQCGAKVEIAIFQTCPNCGGQINPGNAFCASCGSKVS